VPSFGRGLSLTASPAWPAPETTSVSWFMRPGCLQQSCWWRAGRGAAARSRDRSRPRSLASCGGRHCRAAAPAQPGCGRYPRPASSVPVSFGAAGRLTACPMLAGGRIALQPNFMLEPVTVLPRRTAGPPGALRYHWRAHGWPPCWSGGRPIAYSSMHRARWPPARTDRRARCSLAGQRPRFVTRNPREGRDPKPGQGQKPEAAVKR
jgi:hypothetical protein